MLKNLLTIFAVTLFIGLTAQISFGQNEQVANYSTGKYNNQSYEHFSFWAGPGGRSRITYSQHNRDKEIELTYLESTTVKGQKGFKVKFPNDLVLIIVPRGNALKVTDGKGKYNKYFKWEYEGPVDGRGTACTVCVGEDREAITFIKKYFL